jgi:hypothetical protein
MWGGTVADLTALKAIVTTTDDDGYVLRVKNSETYQLDASSSDPDAIAPDSGVGRWFPVTPDATVSTKGIIQLAGDLSGTADAPELVDILGLVPGSYTNVNLTVDAKGRITAAANGSSGSGGSGGAASINNDIVAFWKLSDLEDAAGSHNLTNVGGAPFVPGKVGYCVSLDNSSQYFDVATSSELNFGNTSWSAAARINLVSSASFDSNYLLSKSSSSTSEFDYRIKYEFGSGSSDNFLSVEVGDASGFIAGNFSYAILLATDTWYDIYAAFDSATQALQLRVDAGALQSSSAIGTPPVDKGYPLRLGTNRPTSGFFNGKLDSVGIWSRLLTDDEWVFYRRGGKGREYPFV